MFPSGADPGLDHERAQLVAVQSQSPRLAVDLGSPQMGGRASLHVAFLLALEVEAGQGREPAGDGRGHETSGFHRPAELLQVRALDLEQPQPELGTPVSVDPQVRGVTVPGCPSLAGQEPGDRQQLVPAGGIVEGR